MKCNLRFLQSGWGVLYRAFLLIGVLNASAAIAAEGDDSRNAIEKVEASSISGQTLVKITLRDALANAPASFTVSTPPRIAFDFVATDNATGSSVQQYSLADLQSVNIVQAGGRTRLVLNLARPSRYETRLDGRSLYISLAGAATEVSAAAPIAAPVAASTSVMPEANAVQNIDFRTESSDVARINIEIAQPNPLVDVKKQGSSLIVTLPGVGLPDRLVRRMDVRDFGTPVTVATATRVGAGAQLTIATRGEWDYNVTQLDSQVKIEVRRRVVDPNSLLGAKELQGKTVSFNFTQPVPVSQMIGIFQDITGLNFVMMPGVTGEIDRLKMENTPVETAINVVCRMYGLAMRRFDGLVVVGKAADIAKYEKEEADLQNARLDTEPIEQDSIKVRFRPAAEIVAALTGVTATYSQSSTVSTTIQAQPPGSSGISSAGGTSGTSSQGTSATSTAVGKSMISPRGSISSDSVTNTIFVEETRTQIAKIRDRVNELDRPVKQVMIDARIVSVDTTFSRTLGTKLGFVFAQAGGSINGTPTVLSPNTPSGVTGVTTTKAGLADASGGFNAANTGKTGNFQFALIGANGTRLINAEITAAEADSSAKNIASPKVLTQDGRQATITDGQTIFFQLTGGINGPTTVSIDAATKLEVTPQIGADGKIQMKIYVNKGGVGADFGGRPTVIKQEVVTNAVVENGGTLMLGGVFTQEASNATDRVPLLGDIPYIGWLFKQNKRIDNKKELLIFLTPRVVSDELTMY